MVAPEAAESAPAENAPAEDAAPKFKLKVKPPGGGPAKMPGAATPAPASGGAEAPKDPPPFPVVKPPGPTRPPIAAPVPHMRAPEGVEEEDIQPKAPPPKKFGKKKKRWVLPVIGVMVLGAAAFVVYKFFLAPPPPPPPVVKKPAVSPATPVAPTPAAASHPSSNLIDAGQNAIAERRAKEQARVDALLNGQDVPDARAISTPPPSSLTPAPKPAPTQTTAQATTQISPGLSVTSATELTAGAASPAFRSFVANARISGVYQGAPPRAFINNTLYRAGDIVSPSLGIRFFGVNSEQKTITFRDESGAIVTRKY